MSLMEEYVKEIGSLAGQNCNVIRVMVFDCKPVLKGVIAANLC